MEKFESISSFKKTTPGEVVKDIRNLNIRKSSQTREKFIFKHFNYCIDRGKFPNELKHAELFPVHKKNCTKKTIDLYFSNFSKVYEKFLCNQRYSYFENILFPSQCNFRKGYNAQHCLLVVTEKFKEAIDRGDKFGALS